MWMISSSLLRRRTATPCVIAAGHCCTELTVCSLPPRVTGHNGEDPVLLKKLDEGEGLWEVRKEVLGWMMDGATRCIKLAEKKQDAVLAKIKAVLWV